MEIKCLKLKQLLCSHIWEILYKPLAGKSIQRCIKCEKVQFRKVNNKKMIPRNYCWCPYCGYDLVRDSCMSEDNEGMVSYICTSCNRSSKWHFAIEPSGKVTAKGGYVKFQSPLEYDYNIINHAIGEYFVNNVSVEETIMNCNDLMEFQIISNAGQKYEYAMYGDTPLMERVNRVLLVQTVKVKEYLNFIGKLELKLR